MPCEVQSKFPDLSLVDLEGRAQHKNKALEFSCAFYEQEVILTVPRVVPDQMGPLTLTQSRFTAASRKRPTVEKFAALYVAHHHVQDIAWPHRTFQITMNHNK